ncbi:hypothetical protein [Rothia sp. P4278]|uniref:hypothetical protein n=1 Tax=Rothia sp. P4278 TaxID=3402658 RepID=UPI003AD9A03C
MSNLGGYQIITTLVKKVGGPKSAAGIALGSLGLAYKIGGLVERKKMPKASSNDLSARLYKVTAEVSCGGGLTLTPGNVFRVLAQNEDTVLIAVIGDDDNPYQVSPELLAENSDFDLLTEQ